MIKGYYRRKTKGRLEDIEVVKYKDLNLPIENINRLTVLVNYIKSKLKETDIKVYLFGSYAKGRIKESSDIDLILMSDTLTERELYRLKLDIVLDVSDNLGLESGEDFDILTYTTERFKSCVENKKFFETEVNSYMILL